jgi:EAL domain-containing protein (putative c-di-GMP-specific phosphodiesterase class I)
MRRLSRIMRSCHVAPAEIALEITETSAMGALEEVADRLRGLRDLGVSLWLDDFGTGHSSLEWLSHFPLDGVKIAGTFVSRLPGNRRAEVIAAHIIGLAHELGLRVIAEGVENEEQRALLLRQGCDLLQGFLHHPPLHAGELRAALAAAPPPGVLSTT